MMPNRKNSLKIQIMERNFQRLKSKLRASAIVRCAIVALAIGAAAGAGFVIVRKTMTVTPEIVPSLIIAAAVAAVTFAAAMLIVRPTEKRLAKCLDERLALGEKVQTMVAFRSDGSAMAQTQRADTERILGDVKGRDIRRIKPWIAVVAVALAAALAVLAAIIVPVREIPPVGPSQEELEKDLWTLEEWQIVRMRSLIQRVKDSEMVDEGKTRVVSALEELLTTLEPIKSKAQMKQEVIGAMVKIDAVTDDINTFTAVIRGLRASSNERVAAFSEAIGVPSDPIIESKYQELKAGFAKENFKTDFANFARDLAVSVGSITVADNEDSLYSALKDFSLEVDAFNADYDAAITEQELASRLTELFEGAAETLSAALDEQNANRSVSDSTNRELMDIFGIEWSELPDELKKPDDEEAGSENGDYDDNDDNDDLKSDSGGLGGGEVLYGSNDAIYDNDEQKHLSYGEVIDKYDGKKTTELDERGFTDDIVEWIDDYFADLYYNEDNKN